MRDAIISRDFSVAVRISTLGREERQQQAAAFRIAAAALDALEETHMAASVAVVDRRGAFEVVVEAPDDARADWAERARKILTVAIFVSKDGAR